MDSILAYFVNERGETPVVANILSKSLCKYDDIKNAFEKWISSREFDSELNIGEYNAKKIHELQPKLDAAGVYQFLVTLRDNPQKANEYINNNFSTK